MMSLWDFCLKKVLLLTLKTKKRCVWSHYIECTLRDFTAYSFTVQNTPLHAAASKGHQIIVVLLVEHGADVHSNSQYKRVSWDHYSLCITTTIVWGCVVWKPDCTRSNLRESKFKIFLGGGGMPPDTPSIATHAEAWTCFCMLLSSCYHPVSPPSPTQYPVKGHVKGHKFKLIIDS